MKNKDKYCYYCERPLQPPFLYVKGGQKPTRDHIIPKIKGGRNGAINLVDSCNSCNSFKGGLLPEEFLKRIEWLIETGNTWKHYPVERLVLIYEKTKLLIEKRVKVHGEKLYRRERVKLTPEQRKIVAQAKNYTTIRQINKAVKRLKPPPNKVKQQSADVHLSINTNTRRTHVTDKEHDLFLQHQTIEQFRLAQKHGWRIAAALTEPEVNFHI